jgi:hypothetical protein
MFQAGGRITITLGGVRYSPRGSAKIRPSGVSNSIHENHDGTVSRSTMAKAVGAELSFDRGNAAQGTQRPRWDTAFMNGFVDVTIREVDVGVLHVFSGATIVGDPVLDSESGEISGLSILTDDINYTQTSA